MTRTPTLASLRVLAIVALFVTPAALRAQLDPPLIDTRSTASSVALNQEQLQNVPRARDAWSVLTMTPGVVPEGADRPSIGSTGDALFTVDGIRIGDAGVDARPAPDPAAIEEIQVLTSGATAEYGGAAGGVIQVVTKRGTNRWQGSGRFVSVGDSPFDVGAVQNPALRIDIVEDAAGGFCLKEFQVLSGGQPVANGSSVHFGFDQPFTIGVTSGPGTAFGAADGSVNLSQIPGCDGQPHGLTFFDTPAPYTPPDATHLFLGQNGSYLVDMGRIGASYGIPDRNRTNPNALEDTHVFSSSFYLTGVYEYVDGRFQIARQADGDADRGGAPGGAPNGAFLYGSDPGGGDRDWSMSARLTYDSKAIRTGEPPVQLPDIDGDGNTDSVFLPLSMLSPIGQNAIGAGFRMGVAGTGGGTLAVDRQWASAADDAAVRRTLEHFFSNYEIGEFTIRPRTRESTRGGADPPVDLGGPIIKDRLWIWGSYTVPDRERDDENPAAFFSDSFYEGAPDYARLFSDGAFSLGSVWRAPAGRGVQDIGLEVDGQPYVELRGQFGGDRYAPGGATIGSTDDADESGLRALANALDAPILYVVADGGPTGDVFRVDVVQPESGSVEIHGLLAVEPVAATAGDRARFERELAELQGERYARRAAGYCLQMDALAPPPGTVYRVAPAEKQAAFAPMRRALDAARRLRDAGALHPDSDPADYYHSIRQWAVWTVEKQFDRAGFLDAFVARMEQNFREAGQPWSADVSAAVRSYGEGRWTDIAAILEEASAP